MNPGKSVFVFFIVILSLSARAQFQNVALLNTGMNAAGTGTLPIGSQDLHWQASLTSSVGPFSPAIVCGKVFHTWVSGTASGQWITRSYSCSPNDPANHTCLGTNVDIWYTLTISLPEYNDKYGAYCMTLQCFADNSLYSVSLNGIVKYIKSSLTPYTDQEYGMPKTVAIANDWIQGNNTMVLHVKSAPGNPISWEGILIRLSSSFQSCTPVGITEEVLSVRNGIPFTSSLDEELIISDLLGRVQLRIPRGQAFSSGDLDVLPPGVYLLVTSDSHRIYKFYKPAN